MQRSFLIEDTSLLGNFFEKFPSYGFKKGSARYQEVYSELYEKQKGICPICEKQIGEGDMLKRISLDHSHITGKIRALLCDGCNTTVALYEGSRLRLSDRVPLVQRVVDYLLQHSS